MINNKPITSATFFDEVKSKYVINQEKDVKTSQANKNLM